jgi:NADH:ubiquinone oxidoreductase subunit K
MIVSTSNLLIISTLFLFGLGLYALLTIRNLVRLILALQVMVKSIIILIILAGNIQDQMGTAQSMALTFIIADTIVAVLGMALAVQVKRITGSLDTKEISKLRM